MKPVLKSSELYLKNNEAQSYIVVNQGGTSSGKTYTILQLLYTMAVSSRLHISVCSLSMPHLRKGALKDWIDILTNIGVYSEAIHNRTNNNFTIGQSLVEFFSLDSPGKARGPRRDVLFINEANLIPYQTYTQLELRTRKKIFLDYNPADEFHWIYDQVLTRDDCTFIQSTYKDNPFLTQQEIEKIERLRSADDNLWKVYGLGERGTTRATIYTHWELCDHLPDGGETIYGMDFGYNNPSAMVKIVVKDQMIYVEELIYEPNLTNSDLINILKITTIDRNKRIYADAAEPNRIEEIRRAGYYIQAADKDVKKGIDTVKAHKLFITKSSTNLIKEIRSYKYKEDADGRILEEPVKFNDHAMDAMRYAVHSYMNKPSGVYAIR